MTGPRFCGSCGAALPDPPRAFCTNCGQPVTAAGPAAPPFVPSYQTAPELLEQVAGCRPPALVAAGRWWPPAWPCSLWSVVGSLR